MRTKIIVVFILSAIFWPSQLFSQINSDSLFDIAIKQARIEDYNHAISTANKVLEVHPERDDIDVFIANVYAWKGNNDSAKIFINKAYQLNPLSNELYDSWLNILLWNAEYEELLETIDIAVENKYSNNYNIIIKRLYAYKYLGEYAKGVALFDNKNQILLDSSKINSIYHEMLIKNSRNTITAYYSIDFFDDQVTSPQHLGYIDYARKIKRNTLIFRLNYANRFGVNGFQLEADYYQLLKKGKYLYFNYGAAIYEDLFPKHRAGVEFYFSLKHHFEASIGARYMYFTNNHVPILTGHIAKYISSYWFSIRPYYSIQDIGNSISFVLNARKFGKTSMSYWGVELGFGNSPDERYILDPSGEYFRLSSFRIKIEKNFMVNKTDELRLSFGYAHEETINSVFRNKYTIEIIYKYRL